jgi:hypothetical protein
MLRHWNYLKYVLRHKWFVFVACRACKVSLWQALIHDWHKFLPSEWGPYARTFYKPDGSKQYVESDEFSKAWNLHQKRGKHHWQHWLITWDRGVTEPIEMDMKYAHEMVADWWGAGRAITGKWDLPSWYSKNAHIIQLHKNTRIIVEFKIDGTVDALMENQAPAIPLPKYES